VILKIIGIWLIVDGLGSLVYVECGHSLELDIGRIVRMGIGIILVLI